jgi:ATP:ADP antiporter, AAA family
MTEPLLQRITSARPAELRAALWAFVYFFCLLASYYVLRPIRDEMANQIGRAGLAELFTYVFVAMLVVAPVFGWLTARYPRKQLLPWLYGFFVLNLVGFFCWMQAGGGAQTKLTAQVFYVWASVFNLFVVSVFWSFMADLFDTEQAKRLYGFIAAGGTAGALAGPTLTTLLVEQLGPKYLMLVSAAFLLVATLCIGMLRAWEREQDSDPAARARNAAEDKPIGGSVWAGLRDVLTDRYLLAICIFLFAYSLLSTLLYFNQVDLLNATFKTSVERTKWLARADLIVNVAVLAIQLLAFGALMKKMGTRFMLVVLPVASVIGFVCMAAWPGLSTLMAFGIVRRAGEYAVSKPARETLFNVLPPEQKYKAKNVIDTLVARSGDWLSTLVFTGLSKQGLSMAQLSLLAVPISLGWWATAHWLGGQAQRRQAQTEEVWVGARLQPATSASASISTR